MAQRVLAENAGVMKVQYDLPNKHYIPVDMKYLGVDNTTPYVALCGIRFGCLVKSNDSRD
jgi:urate oxidase